MEIAFASDRDGASKVYILSLATKAVKAVAVGGPPGQLNPAWCTDTKLSFAANGDVYAVDRATGRPTNLTNSSATTESQPACTPDGSRVLFASGTATTRDLFDVSYVGGVPPRRISAPGWLAVDPALNPAGTELAFFGRSPDGRVGLWTNTYRLDKSVDWRPTLRIEVKPPRELRLTKYDAQQPFAWLPRFKRQGRAFFGTDLPQGSTAATGTRSLFFFAGKAFQALGYPARFGEDANPAPRPLPALSTRKGFLGLGGTSGADALLVTFRGRAITVRSETGVIGRVFGDSGRTVVRGGFSVSYDQKLLQRVLVNLAGGADRVTFTGVPPARLELAVDCGPNEDRLTMRFAKITPSYTVKGCERVAR